MSGNSIPYRDPRQFSSFVPPFVSSSFFVVFLYIENNTEHPAGGMPIPKALTTRFENPKRTGEGSEATPIQNGRKYLSGGQALSQL